MCRGTPCTPTWWSRPPTMELSDCGDPKSDSGVRGSESRVPQTMATVVRMAMAIGMDRVPMGFHKNSEKNPKKSES